MKIHEYQAKEILAKYGVAVTNGKVSACDELSGKAKDNCVSAFARARVLSADIRLPS